METSIIIDSSEIEGDDILYQPMEVLDDCELPNPSTTSASDELRTIRATPLKPKLMLQKKVTKSVKKQRDLLEECFAKFNNQVIEPISNSSESNLPKFEKVVAVVERVAPKIVLKKGWNSLTKRDCDLIKDCVEALADQDCVETFKLRTRVDPLCKAEWWKISDILVKLMHQYLPENGIEVINHTHIEQARYQMKETYTWAGYVLGADFQYSEKIRSIKRDSCYEAMRKRNNDMRPRKAFSKRTSARNSEKKKVRLADSYGVLVFEDEEKVSNQRRLDFKMFCDELAVLPVGHQLTQQQIERADSFWDCLMAFLKKGDPTEFHVFQASWELAVLRHLRLYFNFVRRITRREDTVIHKFQDNCDMYLLCLENLLKAFPPCDLLGVKSLDIKNKPYISLVKIIASQLRIRSGFIIDSEVSNDEACQDLEPICLIKTGNFYELWINGAPVVPHMQEIQAVFCLATSEDVFCISQKSTSDSTVVIDFMRKFFLHIPDFHMKWPKTVLLGQAFLCFSELEKVKPGWSPKPNRFLCYEKAKEAIEIL